MTNNDLLVSFLAGALVGTAVAILYAPDSGENTRRRIGQTSREASLKAQHLSAKASGAVSDVAHNVESRITAAAGDVAFQANRVLYALDQGNEAFHAALREMT